MKQLLGISAISIVLTTLFAACSSDTSAPGDGAPAPSMTDEETPEVIPVGRGEGDDDDDVLLAQMPAVGDRVVGSAFAATLADILDEELHSGLGWRPNDLFLIGAGWWTDNVNNKQLGKLEVVRQTCRILKTRIARVDDSSAFDARIEKAESAFFNDATRYMLPSAEKKYREGVAAIRDYAEGLSDDASLFQARSNNLYDLLGYYKDVLGSCHSTLVRRHEPDGSRVSTFKADNYFYYAAGVADAIARMGRAIEIDFREELATRSLIDLNDQALLSLERGASLEPCVVTEGNADGVLANHRLNLSGYVADARQKLHSVRETLKK